jgi:hypothetical protein
MTPVETEPHNFESVPDPFNTALGNLTLRFGQIEHLLAAIIHRATGRKELLSEVRRCFVSWVTSTFDDKEANSRIRNFDRTRTVLGTALERRDELTHCAWGIDQQGEVRATRRGGSLLIDGQPAEQEHIEATTEELWTCFQILNLISRTPEIVPTSPMVAPKPLTPYITSVDPIFAVSATAASYGDPGIVKIIGGSQTKP